MTDEAAQEDKSRRIDEEITNDLADLTLVRRHFEYQNDYDVAVAVFKGRMKRALAAARAEERKKIVTWLRATVRAWDNPLPGSYSDGAQSAWEDIADAIENGDMENRSHTAEKA